jgi:hypothetical protein
LGSTTLAERGASRPDPARRRLDPAKVRPDLAPGDDQRPAAAKNRDRQVWRLRKEKGGGGRTARRSPFPRRPRQSATPPAQAAVPAVRGAPRVGPDGGGAAPHGALAGHGGLAALRSPSPYS